MSDAKDQDTGGDFEGRQRRVDAMSRRLLDEHADLLQRLKDYDKDDPTSDRKAE
jgi:hypothetical protein